MAKATTKAAANAKAKGKAKVAADADEAAADDEAAPDPIDELIAAGHGALLDFVPAERKIKRAKDGWSPELQREFIARLALTGSSRQACLAMRKSPNGVEALYAQPGNEGFCGAWDSAVALAAKRARAARLAGEGRDPRPPHRRVNGGGHDGGGGHGGGAGAEAGGPATDAWDGWDGDGEDEEEDDAFQMTLLQGIIGKFMMKVRQEREARLSGNVPGADFYLRQITMLEVAIDLLAAGHGMRGWDVLNDARRGGAALLEIAATPFSAMLDEARRMAWSEAGEPARPEHPPSAYLREQGGRGRHGPVWTEPTQNLGPGSDPPPGVEREAWARMGMDAQRLTLAELHAAEAEKQLEWERESAERKAAGAQRHAVFDERRGVSSDGVPSGSEDTTDGGAEFTSAQLALPAPSPRTPRIHPM